MKRKLDLVAFVLFAWFCTGCGATQSGPAAYNNVGSALPMSSQGTTGSNTICNEMSTQKIRFDAKLRTVDGSSDMIRVRITGLTTQFDTNPNTSIQFFRWKASGASSPTLDSAALTFHIEGASQNGRSGSQLANNMTAITMANVKKIASDNYMNVSSAEQFFNNVDVIVHGVSIDWQVLKFVIYNGGTSLATNDALIPAFNANPSTYSTSHASVLNGLHPFVNQPGRTDAQYISMGQGLCF